MGWENVNEIIREREVFILTFFFRNFKKMQQMFAC